MSRRIRFLCLSFFFVFSLLLNLYFVNTSQADSLTIGGSNQMNVNGTQTLTVFGGSGSYTCSIESGSGNLSGSSGSSPNYTAPGSNPYCADSPNICVTDSNGSQACMPVAVNAVSSNGTAYQVKRCALELRYGNPALGQAPEYCAVVTVYAGCCPAGLLPSATNPNGDTPGPNDLGNPPDPNGDTSGPNDLGNPTPDSCSGSPSVPSESSANLKSGNLYHSQVVIGKLILSYNSIDYFLGTLGKKWTHNYNKLVLPSSDSTLIILKTENGNIISFRLSGSVFYPESRSGDTSTFIKNSNGTYTQTAKNGKVYNYNSSGQLTSVTDRNSNTTTLTYKNGYLAGIIDQNGRTTTITSTGATISSITDPGGRTYNLAYSNNLISSITDPLANAWKYTYDTFGRMLTKKDPANNTVTYTYDANGKLLTSTDPEGKIRSMNYTQSGSTTFTEKDGGLWQYTYDPVYAVKTAKTDPLGHTTTYTYDSKRNLISTTYPDGSVPSNTYDANSNLTSVTDQLGNVTYYTYNSLNLVSSMTDARGNTTHLWL